MEGFELAYQQTFDFLPEPFNALGAQATAALDPALAERFGWSLDATPAPQTETAEAA